MQWRQFWIKMEKGDARAAIPEAAAVCWGIKT